jgi:hypothetical protein
MSTAITRSNQIQDALWLQAKLVMAKERGMVPTGLYIQALNEMFDDQQKRLTAYINRVVDCYRAITRRSIAVFCDTGRMREAKHKILIRSVPSTEAGS